MDTSMSMISRSGGVASTSGTSGVTSGSKKDEKFWLEAWHDPLANLDAYSSQVRIPWGKKEGLWGGVDLGFR
jgi:hypothetical protein